MVKTSNRSTGARTAETRRWGGLRGCLPAFALIAMVIVVGVVLWLRTYPRPIDGIPCSLGEQLRTHYHAHIVVIANGRGHFPPADIGIRYGHFCLYWTHTHDDSGIIHIEAPHSFVATLGEFFDIWGQPLSRHRVWTFAPAAHQALRAFVNQRPYSGSLRPIRLQKHAAVVIEIGPPFVPPPIPIFPKGF